MVGVNPIATIINGNITFNMVQNSLFYAIGLLERVQINGTLTHTNNTNYNNFFNYKNEINKLSEIQETWLKSSEKTTTLTLTQSQTNVE